MSSIEKKIIITGGTDGIGLAILKKLIQDKHKIIFVGKNETKGINICNSFDSNLIEFIQCDLSEKKNVNQLIEKLNTLDSIDVLINNAGAVFENREENSLGVEKTFALNHMSYFHLSLGLVEKLKLKKNSRIINVASNAHKRYPLDIDDLEHKNNYNGWKAYCRSKLLNIMFTYAFNGKTNTNISCNCLHPGFVNSNFGNNNTSYSRFLINIVKKLFAISNDKAAELPIYLATSNRVESLTGKYFSNFKIKKSSKTSYDVELGNKIWEKSLGYLK